jgi:hypothetical protein
MKKAFLLTSLSLLTLTLTLLSNNGAKGHNLGIANYVGLNPLFAPDLTPPCDDSIEAIASCPNTGCGDLGDAPLNRAKNRFDAAPPSAKNMTLDQIRGLAPSEPPNWNTGQSRASIHGPGEEGSPVTVNGFLLKVKPEGGESCNCGLTHRVDTDVHFALVSDPEDREETSVTAEVTPRVRAHGHQDWVFKNLNDFEGEYIRVRGFLMLDTKHIPQGHRLPGERPNHNLQRATNWEIHPVTQLWRCTKSKKACDHGKGWEEL